MPTRPNFLALLAAGFIAAPFAVSAATLPATADQHAAGHAAASAAAPDAARGDRMKAPQGGMQMMQRLPHPPPSK